MHFFYENKKKFEKVMNKHNFFLHNTIVKQKSRLNFRNKFFNIVARCPSYRNLFAHLKTGKHTKWRISFYVFLESYRRFIKQNQFTRLILTWLISRDLQNTNYGKIANFGFNPTAEWFNSHYDWESLSDSKLLKKEEKNE